MKIGIVTFHLYNNYGCLLQAFAMQRIILSLGYEVKILHYDYSLSQSLWLQVRRYIKYYAFVFINKFFMREQKIFLESNRFIHENIKRTKKCFFRFQKDIREIDVWIVGSDQIWRYEYEAKYKSFFYLDFLTIEKRKKAIAYAASFGINDWDYPIELEQKCSELANDFKAISVREKDSIGLCKDYLNIIAQQMPDPTLLLRKSDYDFLVKKDIDRGFLVDEIYGPYVCTYILDPSEYLNNSILQFSKKNKCKIINIAPLHENDVKRDESYISIAKWIKCIRDAKYFITDSFHGCVFSIIFNKPFICLGNKSRGNARFDTLLKTFHLEDRLISEITADEIVKILQKPIDWDLVNTIHDQERARGLNFLKDNLK